MTPQRKLRERLGRKEILVAPGVYDALSAMMAANAGFEAVYLSGASVAYTRLARPDLGLLGMEAVASVVGLIRERVDLPIIADADTGFGNALNVQRTLRVFERAGASAIQLEDQSLPKRCGHLAGKTLVSRKEMVGKIKAALDARLDPEMIIIARTDAIAVEGFGPALERAAAYAEAGADMLFLEAPGDRIQMAKMVSALAGRLPLMANMVEGGKTPLIPAAELQDIGFRLVIFPGGLVRALAHAMSNYFRSLKAAGTTEPFKSSMLDFQTLNHLLGTETMLAQGRKYDEEADHGQS